MKFESYNDLRDFICKERRHFSRIEFVGLPGSGKTVICNKLTEDLLSSGLRVSQNKTEDYLYKLLITILDRLLTNEFSAKIIERIFVYAIDNEHKNYYELTSSLIRDTGFVSIVRARIRRWLILDIVKLRSQSKNRNSEFVIKDEGFVHRVLTYIPLNMKTDHIEKYLDYCPMPDLIIFIDCDVERAIKNREGDPNPVFDQLNINGMEAKKRYMNAYASGIKIIKEKVSGNCNVKTLSITCKKL